MYNMGKIKGDRLAATSNDPARNTRPMTAFGRSGKWVGKWVGVDYSRL
jgi:hypothetical protein